MRLSSLAINGNDLLFMFKSLCRILETLVSDTTLAIIEAFTWLSINTKSCLLIIISVCSARELPHFEPTWMDCLYHVNYYSYILQILFCYAYSQGNSPFFWRKFHDISVFSGFQNRPFRSTIKHIGFIRV